MPCPAELAHDLRVHRKLSEEILALVESESAALRRQNSGGPLDSTVARKKFLAQLSESLDRIRQHRIAWLRLESSERKSHPEIVELLRENQNLLMKILVLDRENEQALLRKGLVPSRHLPSANRFATKGPHFVANLYQRNSAR
jgi:hypothetical protein